MPAVTDGEDLRKDRVVCAWCRAVLREGPEGRTSHGICVDCARASGVFRVERIEAAPAEVLDRLPFGVIQIDGDGRVRGYSAAEARLSGRAAPDVLGLSFFEEVAPCTSVREFRGRFAEMRAGGRDARSELTFVFELPGRRTLVRVVLTYAAATDTGAVLVREIG